MLLNRIYDEQDLARFKMDRQKTLDEWQGKLKEALIPEELIESFAKQVSDKLVPAPLVAGVEIVHTGARPEQNFSTPLITEFVKIGIAEIEGDQLTLHAQPEDLHYTIKRVPGRWCLHCGEKLPDDQNGEMARLHVAMKHKGIPSPSADDPSGYQWLTYFECVLDDAEHARFTIGA